jgi:predicted RNA-binding protein
MCEAAAYMLENGEERLVLGDVDAFEPEGDEVKLKSIFGEQVRVKARLKSFSLVNHKIILVPA